MALKGALFGATGVQHAAMQSERGGLAGESGARPPGKFLVEAVEASSLWEKIYRREAPLLLQAEEAALRVGCALFSSQSGHAWR